MIFARDKSQMCNNLLQFAHVYAYGREHGRHVLSMRFSYKYPYFYISNTKHVNFFLYLVAKYAAALRLIPTANFKDDCNFAEQVRIIEKHRNVVVSGWNVRFYELFLKYRGEICSLFAFKSTISDKISTFMHEVETESEDANNQSVTFKKNIRLGLHIRRGDYDTFKGGAYYFNNKTYAEHIRWFCGLLSNCDTVHVYISTNDITVSVETFQSLCSDLPVKIHILGGNQAEDLCLLSKCDYIIGPPSTYSLVAAMYNDIPLYRIDVPNPQNQTLDSFKKFDYWFRRII